ncbi:hypothetical protein HZA87_04870, partial [Candidatus Uhrbacteria bacterium]|nr:hypothetical protein [Candidatus Uhrbacteria bacterium]
DVQRDSDARIIAVWMWAVFPDEGLFAAHNWIGLLLHVHVTRPGNMLAWSDEKMARRERRA